LVVAFSIYGWCKLGRICYSIFYEKGHRISKSELSGVVFNIQT
jgi:hypothetical protein